VTVDGGAAKGSGVAPRPAAGEARPADLARTDPPEDTPLSEDPPVPEDVAAAVEAAAEGDDLGLGDRIRPYALTGGRTRPGVDLPLESLAMRTMEGTAALERETLERKRILELCVQPLSVAEVSAHLRVHLGVARVLVGDMKAEGLLDVHQPRSTTDDRPDIKLLERVLDGLQAL
jgi:Protein of unknown function (DUF742)